MAEEIKKHCGTCKYDYLGPGYEPCKSCSDSCDSWVSNVTCNNCTYQLNQDIDEEPCKSCNHFDKWKSMIEETIVPEKYIYFVAFYCEDAHGNTIMNNCFIERDEKLRTMEDIKNILEDIKNKCCSKHVVIINWKELED